MLLKRMYMASRRWLWEKRQGVFQKSEWRKKWEKNVVECVWRKKRRRVWRWKTKRVE